MGVAPEDVPKFVEALVRGKGEIVNGSRMVYPMEGQAMRFLNLLANKMFAWLFSWLLGQQVRDTLCGTKALYREDYERIAANRAYFGDFDPFGDFDLLFGASRLNLRIVDLAVRYHERTYGETNISRFRHGFLLLRMSALRRAEAEAAVSGPAPAGGAAASRAGHRQVPLLVALTLAVEAGLLLWPATVGGQAFFRRDVHLMWFAQTQAYARAWREGVFPLWSPLVSFGQALLADANSQVLYPFTLLRLAIEPWTYYTLYAFTHLLIGGLGAAFLASPPGSRSAGGRERRRALDGFRATALGGRHLEPARRRRLDAVGHRGGAGRGVRPRHARRSGWASVTALQILAGAPEAVLLSTAGLAVLLASRASAAQLRWSAVRRPAAALATAVLLALGLSAAQWVPALDAAVRAGRTRLPREARVHWSIHPANLAQALCPVPLHRLALTAEARQRLFGAPDPFLPVDLPGSGLRV